MMAHYDKNTMSACGHLFKHYERSKDESGKYVKFGNMDIDPNKTDLNYNLAPEQQIGHLECLKKRISKVKCINRADVNVMCSWIITVPKDLPQSEHTLFLKSSYEYLKNKYGENNVISSYVHLDETTPHMHFAFVPVVMDRKKGIEKVSAKECVGRHELQVFHSDLSKHLEKVMGHEVGILNEATKDGNRSIEELKRQSATERLAECSKIVSKAHEEVQAIQEHIQPLKAEYEAHKAFIDESDKVSNVSTMYPDYAKTKKSLLGKETVTVPKEMWEAKHVSANQIQALKKEREVIENKIHDFKNSVPSKKIEKLEQELKESLKLNRELIHRLQKSNKEINSMKEVLELNPKLEKAFLDACNGIGKEISRGGQSR